MNMLKSAFLSLLFALSTLSFASFSLAETPIGAGLGPTENILVCEWSGENLGSPDISKRLLVKMDRDSGFLTGSYVLSHSITENIHGGWTSQVVSSGQVKLVEESSGVTRITGAVNMVIFDGQPRFGSSDFSCSGFDSSTSVTRVGILLDSNI